MKNLIPTLTATFVLSISVMMASPAQSAEKVSGLSTSEIWFLVDTGQMHEEEALFLLDAQRVNEKQTIRTKYTKSTTKKVSGLDLGSGRIKRVSDLDLGSGR